MADSADGIGKDGLNMPAKLKVRIVAGRDLPIMDRSSELTDAFVEVKFSNTTYKTEVCRKSLNPQWNSDWFRFEVDDEDLQDEPLQIRVLDHDTYSAHDAIGKVYIELNPLLSKEHGSVISGWFPIYDTMHGIRGELHVIVKLDLFSDFNKFRQSSCGVQFFCTSGVPYGFRLHALHGFVEELVVNDDPEYQWIDKIRSQRASNEARQIQFSKLSGELQRKLGLKVLEMGGNAVIGYRQCFDLEGESGVVVRAIGTSVTLGKHGTLYVSPHSSSPTRDCASDPNFCPFPSSPTSPLYRPLHANKNTASTPHLALPPVAITLEGRNLLPPRPRSPRPQVISQGDLHHTSLSSLYLETPRSKGMLSKFTKPFTNATSLGSPKLRRSMKALASPKIIKKALTKSNSLRPVKGASILSAPSTPPGPPPEFFAGSSLPLPEDCVVPASPTSQTVTKVSSSPAKVPHQQRRSSDSDIETPPKGGSIGGSSGSGVGSASNKTTHRPAHTNVDALEFPFFSIKMFPPGFLVHLGGMVSARSVKLLDRIHNPDDPETRDAWWTELRTEIRSHARALGCHAVIGYCELTSICDEIIVLSASGTAAIVNLRMDGDNAKHTPMSVSLDRTSFEKEKDKDKEPKLDKKLHVDVNLANQMAAAHRHSGSDGESLHLVASCSACHIPYNESSLPFPVNLAKCQHCRRHKVPDVLFTTIEVPKDLPVVGKGCLVQARICRTKKEAKGETNAKEISDSLPFMEYELYNQLLNKLKLKGMNSLFGLKIQVIVGEQMLVAIATGTAAYSAPLPGPAAPKVLGKMESSDSSLTDIQKRVIDAVNRNKDIYNLFLEDSGQEEALRANLTDDEEDLADLELVTGNRDTFILEVDDAEDAAKVAVLIDQPGPDGFDACTTEHMPGVPHLACNVQMFTRVWRGPISASPKSSKSISIIFDALIRSIYFKLRTMTPCVLCHMEYDIDLHDDNDIQVSVTGISMGVGEPPSLANGLMEIAHRNDTKKAAPAAHHHDHHDDMMFHMDALHDAVPSSSTLVASQATVTSHTSSHGGAMATSQHSHGSTLATASMTHSISGHGLTSTPVMYHKLAEAQSGEGHKTAKSERRVRYYSGPRLKKGIEMTPLSYIPGGKIEYYLGHLNFFIIRETTSIRELGGLSGFLHSFISEVMAICRAHVVALGGNALVAYQMTECVLDDHLHKNQGHCLVNVCGDVVLAQYDMDSAQLNISQTSSRSGGVSPMPPTQGPARRPTPSPRHSPHLERAAARST